MAKIRGGTVFEKRLQVLASKLKDLKTLRVGYLEGSVSSKGVSIPMYAVFNNYGTRRTPPRPFFSNAVADNKGDWPKALAAMLKSTDYDADRTLRKLGGIIVGQIKDSINNGSYAPLAESTIKRKGFDKPLIDTSEMINSTAYEIR